MSSIETGVIFGNIVYEIVCFDCNVIVLNDVYIDIMDYIIFVMCSDMVFRSMWVEFEWENKVVVSINIIDVCKYLDYIVISMNMKCFILLSVFDGECGFLVVNLYVKFVFGEDALVNVSIESNDGEISGFI